MTTVLWEPDAVNTIRKLPPVVATRILRKVRDEISKEPSRYLLRLAGRQDHRIRVGNYRLFVELDPARNELTIRAVRHRREAYKR